MGTKNTIMTEQNESSEQSEYELTLKQKLWLRAYLDVDSPTFGNAVRSALVAYYPDFDSKKENKDFTESDRKIYNAALRIGWENKIKLNIPIEQMMDEGGLSDAYLLKSLAENLRATKLYGKNGIEHGDYNARNKALEMALKLKKKLSDKILLEGGFFSKEKLVIETVLTEEEKAQLAEIERIKKEADTMNPDDTPDKSETQQETEANTQNS